MTESFEDLQFRGTRWYLAEEVDRRLVALNATLIATSDNWEEVEGILEAIKKQVIEPQLKDSKEYLDTHAKPEPHNVEMARYWLEKGIYGTVFEINEILEVEAS